MKRKLFINIHLYLASFFAPVTILVAVSGGLYLVGIKGEVVQQEIYRAEQAAIDTGSASLQADVNALLAAAGVQDYDYEYVKVKGTTLYTRPTTRDHYVIKLAGDAATVFSASPSLQSRLIELHKGHGPGSFKTFQKIFAVALVFVMASGLWLGLSAVGLRRSTTATAVAGSVLFVLLAI